MKTKLVRNHGYYQLFVADEQVNSFHKSPSPILLGCLSNYFDSKNWTLSDIRLSEHLLPSPYLINSIEEYKAHDEEEFALIISQLKTYRTSDKPLQLIWNTYNTVVMDDADNQPSLSGLDFPDWACFSYKKGLEKLLEMKAYWENVNEKQITIDHFIHNTYRQPHSSTFFMDYFQKNRDL